MIIGDIRCPERTGLPSPLLAALTLALKADQQRCDRAVTFCRGTIFL